MARSEGRINGTRQLTWALGGSPQGASAAVIEAFDDEVRRGERFEFGRNWQRFLRVLSEPRIRAAEHSLLQMLGVESLAGKRFLDVGSGSGLFSLAARRLGATVCSFDYDPNSISCAAELKRRYFPCDAAWSIERGSVLDRAFLASLGEYDIVYSWGVLHHTGGMWEALDNVSALVADGGQLFIAIYNDLGGRSRRWRAVKRLYCSNWFGKMFVGATTIPYFTVRDFVMDCLRRQSPFLRYRQYQTKARGMSVWFDLVDWLGGYPYEVAKPEDIFQFYRNRGFVLTNLITCGAAHGCNEFVFRRAGVPVR